jgi:hypothetical protein
MVQEALAAGCTHGLTLDFDLNKYTLRDLHKPLDACTISLSVLRNHNAKEGPGTKAFPFQ